MSTALAQVAAAGDDPLAPGPVEIVLLVLLALAVVAVMVGLFALGVAVVRRALGHPGDPRR